MMTVPVLLTGHDSASRTPRIKSCGLDRQNQQDSGPETSGWSGIDVFLPEWPVKSSCCSDVDGSLISFKTVKTRYSSASLNSFNCSVRPKNPQNDPVHGAFRRSPSARRRRRPTYTTRPQRLPVIYGPGPAAEPQIYVTRRSPRRKCLSGDERKLSGPTGVLSTCASRGGSKVRCGPRYRGNKKASLRSHNYQLQPKGINVFVGVCSDKLIESNQWI